MKTIKIFLLFITLLVATTFGSHMRTRLRDDKAETQKCLTICKNSGYELSEYARESTFVCECGNKTYFSSKRGGAMNPIPTDKISNIKTLKLRHVGKAGPQSTPAQSNSKGGVKRSPADQATWDKFNAVCSGGTYYHYADESTYFTTNCPNGKHYFVKREGPAEVVPKEKIKNIQGLISESRKLA